jgi:predicted cation transporter
MIQLYFLSILCNGLAGFVLFTGNDNLSDNISEVPKSPMNISTFHLVLGILSAVTGVLKLLSPVPLSAEKTQGILILGDFIPALACLAAGLMLIFGIYRQDMSAKAGELDRLGVSLLAFRKPIGLGLFAAAAVHFLFPQVLFL